MHRQYDVGSGKVVCRDEITPPPQDAQGWFSRGGQYFMNGAHLLTADLKQDKVRERAANPYKGDVPTAAVVYVAQQLGLPPELYAQYAWTGRIMVYHRIQIRQALGFRESTEQDIDDLTTWLCQEALRHEHRPDRVQEAVHARYRAAHLEPPAPKRVDRLVRSALHTYEDQVQRQVLDLLGPGVYGA